MTKPKFDLRSDNQSTKNSEKEKGFRWKNKERERDRQEKERAEETSSSIFSSGFFLLYIKKTSGEIDAWLCAESITQCLLLLAPHCCIALYFWYLFLSHTHTLSLSVPFLSHSLICFALVSLSSTKRKAIYRLTSRESSNRKNCETMCWSFLVSHCTETKKIMTISSRQGYR